MMCAERRTLSNSSFEFRHSIIDRVRPTPCRSRETRLKNTVSSVEEMVEPEGYFMFEGLAAPNRASTSACIAWACSSVNRR